MNTIKKQQVDGMVFKPIELSERDNQLILEHQELAKSMIDYFSSRLRLPKELCQIDDKCTLAVSHAVGLIKK